METEDHRSEEIGEEKAIALLKRYSHDEREFRIVLAHAKKVEEIALRIASRIKGIDMSFLKDAALLHDIGRFDCPPKTPESVKHGIRGGEIMRKEGFERIASVCENHLGAGISKEDVIEQGLPLPKKDYIPLTVEEKIITYADLLTAGDKEITIEQAKDRFMKEIGKKEVRKIEILEKEIEDMQS